VGADIITDVYSGRLRVMRFRRYFVVNRLTGYPAFGGRRFWTVRGAARAVYRLSLLGPEFFELRKFL
jgi:hypothetical protein